MAGLGRKTFIATEVLTAANVNGYLMDQTVMRFADSTARSSAIGTAVAEGMVSYLDSTDALEVYNGSSWGAVSSSSSGNAIINGAFDFWQRGTSLTYAGGYPYLADRWRYAGDGSGATRTQSQQSFTPGANPVAGYDGKYFYRFNQSVAGTGGTFSVVETTVENVESFAGQTITFSFWAKADAARTVTAGVSYQIFGSGGSSNVNLTQPSVTLTTSWARYSVTQSIPSISGKTVGTGSHLIVGFDLPKNVTQTIDIWGVQLESGSSATAFKRNASNIQGELAACQRYYYRATADGIAYGTMGIGMVYSATGIYYQINFPVPMRINPSVLDYTGLGAQDNLSGGVAAISTAVLSNGTRHNGYIDATSSGGHTTYRPAVLRANNNGNAYIGFSAEF